MTADFTLRLAESRDVAPLHQLIESAYRGDSARRGWTHEADLLGGQRTDLAALATILDDPHQALLVLVASPATDSGVAACVVVADLGQGLSYLGMLAVDPARQAGGIGARLISAAEAHARRHFGARRIEMTVISHRAELIAYYQRRGYALTGETRPFPYGDRRFGDPMVDTLEFVVLEKPLAC